MLSNKNNFFKILNEINVNDHTEVKNGLTYLAWMWAWQTLKELYPESRYIVYENPDNGWNYFTDGRTCWVKTGVTIVYTDDDGITKELEAVEMLPIMDYKNKSIPLENVTSMDVNKAIQRSLTKCIARHGLGAYIYNGSDAPEESEEAKKLSDIIRQVDAEVKRLTSKMSADKKKKFAEEYLIPTIGQINYMTCTDPEKLTLLLTNLKTV